MTTLEKKQGNNLANTTLDQGILQLMQESQSGSGLEGLLSFEEKLSKKERKLTPSQVHTALEQVKTDIQNPEFLSFESGTRDGKVFGFEGLGIDVIPTLTPNGDCIVPVNFWYDGQRRTILLVFMVDFQEEGIQYLLPEGENFYCMTVGKQRFEYELLRKQESFKMLLKAE
ncbi:MAG: hypothetical protein Q4B28_06325 [bacterium]|nr:hypothetical protein [bacterium]